MPDSRQIKKPKKKVSKPQDSNQSQPEKLSKEKQKKLEDLDDFIEGVLEEAGEDFLDQFKQIEGEYVAPADLWHRV
jgi:predicted ATP-grasp superfamily ATP-dependent carboligase